jgi:hypothetical protein
MNNTDLDQTFPEEEDHTENPTASLIQNNDDNNTLIIGNRLDAERGTSRSNLLTCSCKHPVAAFFHLFFKIAALFCYLFLTFFTSNFVLVFVTCILLLSFDFWTVKNITGRLLVGLRWWNEIQPDGTSVWRFESKEDRNDIDIIDSYVFWIALYAHPLIWLLLSITCFIGMKFQWFMIILFALVLGISNLIGYFKCQRDAANHISSWIIKRGFAQSIASRLFGAR